MSYQMDYAGQAASPSPARKLPSPADRVCTGVRIEKAANGGFTVTHNYRSKSRARSGLGDAYLPSEDYVFAHLDGVIADLKKAFR